jgi:hypothetical protein
MLSKYSLISAISRIFDIALRSDWSLLAVSKAARKLEPIYSLGRITDTGVPYYRHSAMATDYFQAALF